MSSLDFVQAADTANMQAGGQSFFGDVGDALTKGVGAALVSGAQGIYNTGVDLSNKIFNTQKERADTAETLTNLDRNWGAYYEAHQGAIDFAGFVAGSIIPGSLAVKGLKAIQAGESFGAFGRVLGYTSRMENAYLNNALTELATEGGTVFTRINQAKLTSMAWGAADNILQTAAFETAAALTAKSSPMLDNADWKDITWDIVKTSVIGGTVFGGGINAFFTNKIIKDAGKALESKQRLMDVLTNPGTIKQSFGDDAFNVINALAELPKEVLDPTVRVIHNKTGSVKVMDSLPEELVGKLLDKTRQKTVDIGILKFEKTLTNVVPNDKTVGIPLAKALVDIWKQGVEAGESPEAISRVLGGHLLNLHSVEGIGTRPLDMSGELRYLNPKGDISKSSDVFSSTPQVAPELTGQAISDNAPGRLKAAPEIKQQIFRVIGDESEATQGVLGRDALSMEEAWKKNFDTVLDPVTRTVSVNPNSAIYQRIDQAEVDFAPRFFNTSTLRDSDTVVPTIADVQTIMKPLTVNSTSVISGNKTYQFSTGIYNAPVDSLEATARHVWAQDLKTIGGQIDIRDISVLEALRVNPSKAGKGLKIYDPDTRSSVFFSDISNFDRFVFQQKYNSTIDRLRELNKVPGAMPKIDLREVAYRMNVSGDWMEKAVSTKFSQKELFNDPGWLVDPARFNSRENLIFRYDTQAVKDANSFSSDAIVAFNQRVKMATDKAMNASAAVIGQEDYKLLITLKDSLAKSADSQTVGASLLGASNADYLDKLRSWGQYTGQIAGNITNKRVSSVVSTLQSPGVKVLSNPPAAAEISAATTSGRLSTDAWSLWKDPLTEKYQMVDNNSFEKILKGGKIEFAKQIPLSEDTGAFLSTHHDLYKARLEQQSVLKAAQGIPDNINPNVLYFPPVDTQRVPFFAFVRQSDGTIFGSSEVSMITAKDAGELQALVAQIEKDKTLSVTYKKGTEEYHKAKGDYDFNRSMNAPVLDSTLRSKGLLGSYLPNMTPEAVVEDFIQYHQRAETKLVRDALSVNYAQTIAELQDLSNRYTAGQTSKFEGLSKLLQRNVKDPFNDAIKLALNVSKQSEFTLWHQTNEFVDALGTKAFRGISKATLDARGGKISWEEANDKLEQFGLGRHFTDEDAFMVAQTAPDRNIIKIALQKANMLIANGMLRLDFANSLLNTISTPILLSTEVSSIKNSFVKDPAMRSLLEGLTTETVPGTAVRIPSTARLIFNAVAAYPADELKLLDRFKEIGTVKGPAALFHAMIGDLSLTPKLIPNKYADIVNSWVDKGARLTFSDQAEDFTRYVSSHVMWQITEPVVKAGKMSVQEQNAYISIFTNRVQGNYVASQRPILFQGTVGSAIGLFQTYQFNLFQQLFRHIENKDAKTIAVMGAMQGTLFGLNGLPMFAAINTQLVGNASINAKNADAYSYAVQAAGKPIGDWLLYGTASAFPLFSEQAPALWTRGDLNPRSTFILPTSPMEVPAIGGSLKVINAVINMAKQLGNGAGIKDALLTGLEHNGLSRPLTGLAQVLKGNATTTKGDLISASSDWFSIANAARLTGATPMDESIGRTTMFRSSAYQAVDKQRTDELGSVIKDKLRNNQTLTSEDWTDFQGKYAAAGGRIEGFTRAVQRWDKAANVSVVNSLMQHSQTMTGQRMAEVMGGDPLIDYRNQTEGLQ